MDFYCGGIEHAQMHLIYARFMTKALRDLGLTSIDEPFNELLCQGMVNKSAPFCAPCGVTHPVVYEGKDCPQCGEELTSRSAKMSKSMGNTVSPEAMIEQYGADTVRLFILFAANPTAGMDWSDTALEANHRVMVQLQHYPTLMRSWSAGPSEMDAWMAARFKQRTHEFVAAMEEYDLRRAVEISHYELIKDINWYVRRGGGSSLLAESMLPTWAQMISISTPHLAEEWWATLDDTSATYAASSEIKVPDSMTSDELGIIAGEQYVRDFLEQARRVQVVAERHLGSSATAATIVTSAVWKRTLARAALTFISEGGHPKNFMPVLAQHPLAQGERKGEVMSFWGKKMLPQVFKWDDASKVVVSSSLDEAEVLSNASSFIAAELQLKTVNVVVGGSAEDLTGRAASAMPLSPAVVYA